MVSSRHRLTTTIGALALALGLVIPGAPAGASPPAPPETLLSSPEPDGATPLEVEPSRRHRFSVYGTVGALAYVSDAQSIGGVGGGIGLRDILDDRYILQADFGYLTLIGNVAALRVGAGVQRTGTWSPAVLLTLTTLVGDRLSVRDPDHPTAIGGPALSLGVTVAPVRFDFARVQVSLLQVGVGVGTDFPGLGINYSLSLLEIGAAL